MFMAAVFVVSSFTVAKDRIRIEQQQVVNDTLEMYGRHNTLDTFYAEQFIRLFGKKSKTNAFRDLFSFFLF